MTFGDARWLWALALLPLLALVDWRARVRAGRALATLVGERPEHALLEQRRAGQLRLGMALRLFALALLAVGASDPQWGRELVRRGASGSDVVMALDVSASMDTRDVAPSRLEEARREALAVIDRLEGSRVGVVAFAGDAVRLCPLTLDVGAARLTVEGLGSGSVSDPGTDIGRALRAAAKLMPAGRREEQAIVLWTDGEDLEHGAGAALDELARAGIRVFAVGVGTPAGDIVPVLDDQGRIVEVRRDESGAAVRSRLDEELLRSIARRSRGAYFAASRPGGDLPRLLAALSSLSRSDRGQRLIERPVSRFPWFGAAAALTMVLDRLRARRRTRGGNSRGATLAATPQGGARAGRLAARGAAVAIALVIGTLCLAGEARAQSAWARGDAAFRHARWAEAESLYALRLRRGPARAAEVNLATARGEQGKREAAEADLGRLSGVDDRAGRAAGYNLGTMLGERQAYDDGLKELRRSLERDPGDAEARWNYEWLTRKKSEQNDREHRPPTPKPSGGGAPPPRGGQGGGGAQPPQHPLPQPSPPRPGQPAPGPPSGMTGTMNRTQADQILNALEEQARLQQGQRRVRVMKEKRGRDW